LQLRNQRKGWQIKAGRPKPHADGHQSAAADFCDKIGAKRTLAFHNIRFACELEREVGRASERRRTAVADAHIRG
jgi:hypothetical protein